MPILSRYKTLKTIALTEFSDVVNDAMILALPTGEPLKLRLEILDGTFVDVFLSASGRFSYHWERRLAGKGDLYRHDNAPHGRWRHIATFPKHFHEGSEENVAESYINDQPEQAIRDFLLFIRQKLLLEA
jgi:hypothetical protein